jgi:hypothetical protein
MIQPNVRASFGRREAEILLALAGPSGEAKLCEKGIDALLDDGEILSRLLRAGGVSMAPAPLLFYLMVRHSLLAREILDRRMADYVAAVLLEFGKADRAFRAGEGEPGHQYLSDLLAEIDRTRGDREYMLRVHLGNFALWLGGLFPDHITHRVQRRGAPPLSYYDELGAVGFRTAAGMDLALRHGLGDLFLDVSERFTDVRSALNGLSDTLLFPRPGDPVERVLREVSDRVQRGVRMED